MPSGLSGLIIAGILAAMLVAQALRAVARSRLRLAYGLGAGAMALVALFNLLALLQVQAPMLGGAIIVLGLALLAGSVGALALAMFNGELRAKLDQARQVAAAERERQRSDS
ncbi:MAG: hypothetical protein AB4911_03235 [Oscillochloridaceae bacterium umkhey_bin13]